VTVIVSALEETVVEGSVTTKWVGVMIGSNAPMDGGVGRVTPL